MAKIIKIKILGWEKINNTRKDVTNPSWFKFKHKFFDDPDLFGFTHEEKLSWLFMLCEASKQNKNGLITLYFDHAERTAKLSAASILSAAKKLKQLQIIEILALRQRTAGVPSACPRQEEKREEKKREEEIREERAWPIEVDLVTQEAQAKLLRIRKEIEGRLGDSHLPLRKAGT